MRKTAVAVAAITGVAAAYGSGKAIEDSTPPPMPILSTEISGSDLGFFMGAAPQTALLLHLSDLAKAHATTPEVKAEAATVWKEQTDAEARLKDLAARKHVPLDPAPDTAGAAALKDLGTQQGVKFDKSFLDAQSDAEDALQASLQAGAGSADADIKAFAQAGLETLKAERERVRKLGL